MDYEKIYNDLCASRKYRGIEKETGYEVHHILPRSMGGNDDEKNLVKLTYREHYIAHKLLVRFCKGNNFFKMRHAFYFMSGLNGKRVNNSYFYSRYKVELSKEKPYIGAYLIDPCVLPEDLYNTSNPFEEILQRLVYLRIEKFILPTPKRYYPQGRYTTARKLMHEYSERNFIVKHTLDGAFSMYLLTDEGKDYLKGRGKSKYTYTPINYCVKGYGKSPTKGWRKSEYRGVIFSNPMTRDNYISLKEQIETSSIRENTYQKHYTHYVDSLLSLPVNTSIIDEYKSLTGVKRFHHDTYYPLLSTLHHYCSKGISIGFGCAANFSEERRVYSKLVHYMCKRFNYKYYPSVCLEGGHMSVPVLSKDINFKVELE